MELNFSKSSWHYRLAKFGGMRIYGWDDFAMSICDYTGKVVWGMILYLVALCLITLASICFLDAISWLIVCFSHGFVSFTMHITGFLATIVVLFCLTVGVGVLVIDLFASGTMIAYEKISGKTYDNFISHAYNSFKNKVCVPVTFNKVEK